MKNRLRKIANAYQDLNQNLYVSLEEAAKGNFELKDEVWDEIQDNIEWEIDQEASKGYKSRDRLDPDEPAYAYANLEGKYDIKSLESKFGALSDLDVQNIITEIREDNQAVISDLIFDTYSDLKSHPITRVNSFDIEISENGSVIVIETESNDIEFDEEF